MTTSGAPRWVATAKREPSSYMHAEEMRGIGVEGGAWGWEDAEESSAAVGRPLGVSSQGGTPERVPHAREKRDKRGPRVQMLPST